MPANPLAAYRSALAALSSAILEADPAARPDRGRWLGQGWGAAAIRVPSPSGDWVVRLPKPASWWAMDDLEREMRLLPLLARQPFTVLIPQEPHLISDQAGRPAGAMHRMVPGTPLGEQGTPRGAARARLCEDVGGFLSTLHATPVASAARHGARSIDLWRDQYVPIVHEALEALPPNTRAWLERAADDFERAGGSSAIPRVLIHADISGDHLLLDETGALSGVIDFADAVVGDPALDFAGVLNDLGWRDLERVWTHYGGEVDERAIERTRFYIAVAPIYQVVYGEAGAGPEERRRGIRRLTARAAAASRG